MKLEIELTDDQVTAIASAVAEKLGSRPKRSEPYPLKDAAEALGWGVNTLRRRVNAGQVKRVPHITKIMIPAAEIERLQEGRSR